MPSTQVVAGASASRSDNLILLFFIPQLRNRWIKNFGNAEKLKEILSRDNDLWFQISKYFSRL